MACQVLTVVGARPQFIKAAVVSHELARRGVDEALVHTGQHYDYNMSETFFRELDIPEPRRNLGISGGTHAQMTARMLEALEGAMVEEEPGCVLLYGDTNSTLAGALAAAKLRIPIVHVEAGTRTHNRENPEEINRVCTDHVASRLLACTRANLENLEREGLGPISSFAGDPMFEAFSTYRQRAVAPQLVNIVDGSRRSVEAGGYYYLTCHREENTRDSETLRGILDAMEELDAPVVYPVHPRNKQTVLGLLGQGAGNVLAVEPVGYLESVWLTSNARQVVTDSGGLQREAFFAGVKCTTVLDFEVWPETMVSNRNLLARAEKDDILSAMSKPQTVDSEYQPFGDGRASAHIADALLEQLGD